MKEDNNNNDLDHDIDLSIILQIKSEQSFFLTTWKFTGETLTDSNGIQTHKNLVCKRTVSPVWLNSWVFVYKLSGSKFESCYCHLTSLTFRQEIGLINFDVFSEREKLLLTLRTQIKEISNVCYHHTNKFTSSNMQCRKENEQIHSNYTRNHIKVWLNRYKLSFHIFQMW